MFWMGKDRPARSWSMLSSESAIIKGRMRTRAAGSVLGQPSSEELGAARQERWRRLRATFLLAVPCHLPLSVGCEPHCIVRERFLAKREQQFTY